MTTFDRFQPGNLEDDDHIVESDEMAYEAQLQKADNDYDCEKDDL